MKATILISMLLLSACGGKLTKEERDKLHEGMATQDIKRVTDAELELAATEYGKLVMAQVEQIDPHLNKKKSIDSLATARNVSIYSLIPDKASLRELEQKLVEAYIAGTAAGTAGDNLQALGEDSLLFTRPVFRLHPDGSQEFSHAIGIRMSKKVIILSMPQP